MLPYILRINFFTLLLSTIFCSTIRLKKYHKATSVGYVYYFDHTSTLVHAFVGKIWDHSFSFLDDLPIYLFIYPSQIIVYQSLLSKTNSLSASVNSTNGDTLNYPDKVNYAINITCRLVNVVIFCIKK